MHHQGQLQQISSPEKLQRQARPAGRLVAFGVDGIQRWPDDPLLGGGSSVIAGVLWWLTKPLVGWTEIFEILSVTSDAHRNKIRTLDRIKFFKRAGCLHHAPSCLTTSHVTNTEPDSSLLTPNH